MLYWGPSLASLSPESAEMEPVDLGIEAYHQSSSDSTLAN